MRCVICDRPRPGNKMAECRICGIPVCRDCRIEDGQITCVECVERENEVNDRKANAVAEAIADVLRGELDREPEENDP